MTQVYKIHKRDPNFPDTVLHRIEEFLSTSRPQIDGCLQTAFLGHVLITSSQQTMMMSMKTLKSMNISSMR